MQAIDFARARIGWTTHDGSHGSWRVVAAARCEGGEDWYLAAGVMAGDVYGAGRLPLEPPYSFQLIASRDRHVIFREPVETLRLQDTVAPNSDSFSQVSIDIPEIEAATVPFAAEPAPWPSMARLCAAGPVGLRWMLEFPVNHINQRDKPPGWQIETGPVIVPCDLVDIPGAAKQARLQLAYVLCNRPDRVDLLAFGALADSRRGYAHFARLEGVEVVKLAAR